MLYKPFTIYRTLRTFYTITYLGSFTYFNNHISFPGYRKRLVHLHFSILEIGKALLYYFQQRQPTSDFSRSRIETNPLAFVSIGQKGGFYTQNGHATEVWLCKSKGLTWHFPFRPLSWVFASYQQNYRATNFIIIYISSLQERDVNQNGMKPFYLPCLRVSLNLQSK